MHNQCQKTIKFIWWKSIPEVSVLKGPSQNNSYDFGIYALSAVDCIVQGIINGEKLEDIILPNLNTLDCLVKLSFLASIMVNGMALT